jgi:hypothetical protein
LTIEAEHPRTAVAIPLRNEVKRLPRLLSALADQNNAPPFLLCLFLDNCDDGSAQLLESWASRLPYPVATRCCFTGCAPNAGAARRQAMALAIECMSGGTLMTTDADSEPANDWIAANLQALRQADVVAGRVVQAGPGASAMQERVIAYFDRLHALRRIIDPVPWESDVTHHWTSGASLAMTSDIYRALGGFSEVPQGEDAAFGDAAGRAGYRLRRDGRVLVATSSRRKGRAQHGFAAALAGYDADPDLPQVAHPQDEAWRFRLHARARDMFGSGEEARALAPALGLSDREIADVASECRNGEAFAARIVGAPAAGMRLISLAHAEAALTGLEQIDLVGAA